MIQIDKIKVSNEAFIQEIANWQLTLTRQNKKLKNLIHKISNKILVNQLNILITSIQGEIIQYRKFKDIRKLQKIDIIQEYNYSSKRFMDLMENIGNFADKAEQAIYNELDASQIHKQNYEDANNFGQKTRIHQKKKSNFENLPKKYSFKDASNNKKKNLEVGISKNSMKTSKYQTKRSINSHSFSKPAKIPQEYDSWEIKYQLKEIKSMMLQIKNQIQYHNHEDIQKQMVEIQHNNKKMNLQLKSIRQDSQYVINRIQKLKEQLQAEKQIQHQMITEFESPQGRVSFKNSRKKSQNHNQSENQNISEWVKVRI